MVIRAARVWETTKKELLQRQLKYDWLCLYYSKSDMYTKKKINISL